MNKQQIDMVLLSAFRNYDMSKEAVELIQTAQPEYPQYKTILRGLETMKHALLVFAAMVRKKRGSEQPSKQTFEYLWEESKTQVTNESMFKARAEWVAREYARRSCEEFKFEIAAKFSSRNTHVVRDAVLRDFILTLPLPELK